MARACNADFGLTSSAHCVFIPRPFLHFWRAHETRRAGRPEAGRWFLGRFRGRHKKPARWSAGRRSARSAGFANPFDPTPRLANGRRNPVRQARDPGASQAPVRGLASPWRLPALHSLFGTEKGNGRPRARLATGVAERWLHSLLIVACLFV